MERSAFKVGIGALLASAAVLALLGAAAAAPPPDAGSQGKANGHGKPAENATSGEIVGLYVRLETPANDTVVAGYTSEGVLYFDAVMVPGYRLSNKTFDSSIVNIEGALAAAQVHDTPSATLRLTLEAGALALYEVAEGFLITAGTDGTVNLTGGVDDKVGVVWTNCGEGTLTGDPAMGLLRVAADRECNVFFRARAVETVVEAAISEATETAAVAAEIDVVADAAEVPAVTEYSEVHVEAAYNETVVAEVVQEAVVTVTVASETAEPKSIVVRCEIPPGMTETTVYVDGTPISKANDLKDALDPTDDAGAFEYNLTTEAGGGVVIVSMPETSSHIVEIKSAVAAMSVPPAAVPIVGAALGISLVVVATGMLFRRRR